eukprot:jgi/Bigna1/88814/estExt_fgenesh1_pg.C_380141
MVVIRHSVRLDNDKKATWPGRNERPYDSPICDKKLPIDQADVMKKKGYGGFDLIVCSPYTRCLQTAALIAKHLGVSRLRVNKSIGEVRRCVRKIQKAVWGPDKADGKVEYLSKDSMESILKEFSDGFITKIEPEEKPKNEGEKALGVDPEPSENDRNGKVRMMSAMRALFRRHCVRCNDRVLLVTHGDGVDAAVREFVGNGTVAYDTAECAWGAYELEEDKNLSSNKDEDAADESKENGEKSSKKKEKVSVKLAAYERFQMIKL